MPDMLHYFTRFTSWIRRRFSSAATWFRDPPTLEWRQPEGATPVATTTFDGAASQPWQASAQANGFTTPAPERQSPQWPPRELSELTGAPDITPQITSLNSQGSTPLTPRPLARHISRPLASRGEPQFENRPGYPPAFLPPNQSLPGQGNLGAPPTPPTYQASGPNDDTLPPRSPNIPAGPSEAANAPHLPSLNDLDAPTLPSLNLVARAGSAGSNDPTPGVQPPQGANDGRSDDEGRAPSPQAMHIDDEDADDNADDDDDVASNDPLAVEDALARALAGRDDALSAFDDPDGSHVTRRRMFFLRYLVRRRVYNEGFAPGEAPPQYHHSLGLDDDGADDTLPEA